MTNTLTPEQYLAICKQHVEDFIKAWKRLRVGQKHATGTAVDHKLTVCQVAYPPHPKGLDPLVWIDKTEPDAVLLSEDGRYVLQNEWHRDETNGGDPVYFELWEVGHAGPYRGTHGYVDPVTRKVVQYG